MLCYLGLRMLVNSRFGNVLVAIRENPERAELLGYDIRRYQLAAFVIGSTLAGLSGALYTAWGQFIVPASMALPAAAMPIIWVAVGGRKDLTATLIGTLFVLWLFQNLIVISQQYALIVIGALLLVTMLFMPGGYVVWLVERAGAFSGGAARRAQRAAARAGATGGRAMTSPAGGEHLEKRFGGLKAVDDLSLAIEEGELHCLIGPNGAGKSTFFKLVLGRYPPTRRHACASAARTSPGSTPPPASGAASASRCRCPACSPSCRCVQNLTIALQNRFDARELSSARSSACSPWST